jgi:hypothetical protein
MVGARPALALLMRMPALTRARAAFPGVASPHYAWGPCSALRCPPPPWTMLADVSHRVGGLSTSGVAGSARDASCQRLACRQPLHLRGRIPTICVGPLLRPPVSYPHALRGAPAPPSGVLSPCYAWGPCSALRCPTCPSHKEWIVWTTLCIRGGLSVQ